MACAKVKHLIPVLFLAGAACSRPKPQPLPPGSVAVLPFTAAPGGQADLIAAALPAEVADSLASIPQLRVIAPESSLRAARPETLGAGAFLSGSVEDKNGLLKITLRLKGAADGFEWGHETLSRSPAEMIRVHDQVAGAVAGWLHLPDPRPQLKSITSDLDAYTLFQRGLQQRYHAAGSLDAEIAYYEQAVRRDIYFARAYQRLAEALLDKAKGPARTKDLLDKLLAAAKRAVDLNPDAGRAHAAYGEVMHLFEWRPADASLQLRDAIRLQPSNAKAHLAYAVLLIASGRPEEAAGSLATAERLDPVSATSPEHLHIRLLAGLFNQQAKSPLLEAVSESNAGNYAKAVDLMQGATVDAPLEKLFAAIVYRSAGRLDKAVEFAKSVPPSSSPVLLACAAVILNEKETAFRLLDRAIQERDPQLIWLKRLPMLAVLQADPRYQKILDKAGLGNS
jgi:tetratricopeptide (TPR) repeat protein/TolB-like protein